MNGGICLWPGELSLPLAYSEVTRWAATQVATLSIGATITAGRLGRATFIDVLTSSTELFELEASRTCALVTPQRIVTGSSATDVSTQTFILICKKTRRQQRWAWVFDRNNWVGSWQRGHKVLRNAKQQRWQQRGQGSGEKDVERVVVSCGMGSKYGWEVRAGGRHWYTTFWDPMDKQTLIWS